MKDFSKVKIITDLKAKLDIFQISFFISFLCLIALGSWVVLKKEHALVTLVPQFPTPSHTLSTDPKVPIPIEYTRALVIGDALIFMNWKSETIVNKFINFKSRLSESIDPDFQKTVTKRAIKIKDEGGHISYFEIDSIKNLNGFSFIVFGKHSITTPLFPKDTRDVFLRIDYLRDAGTGVPRIQFIKIYNSETEAIEKQEKIQQP